MMGEEGPRGLTGGWMPSICREPSATPWPAEAMQASPTPSPMAASEGLQQGWGGIDQGGGGRQ